MPIKGEKYHIVPFEDGWRVMADNGTFYSVKPLTKTRARAQQRALYAKQRKGEIFHGGSYSLITHDGKCDCVLKGSGWLGDIFAKVKKTVSNAIGAVTSRVNAVSKGIRNNYPPAARDTIARFGSGTITHLRLRREPIRSMLNKAFDIITMGQWNPARRDLAFDTLYHLSLIATVRMPDGSEHNILMEKNEVINISPDYKSTSGMNYFDIDVPCCVNLSQFLQNAEAKGGADYFKYDAFTNNCQMFINLLLDANGLNTPEARQFVLQDVAQLLPRLPGYTSKVARFATDLGGIANVAMYGEGKKGKKIEMKPADFFKEHTGLVKLLSTTADTLQKEAKDQATEAKGWKRKLEGRSTKMVGGVRLNGAMVLHGGVIDRDSFLKRQSRGVYPKDMSYEKFVEIETGERARIDKEVAALKESNAAYTDYIKANPEMEDVVCKIGADLEPARGRDVVPRAECDARHYARNKKIDDATPFGKIMKGLTTVGDVMMKVVPMPAIVKQGWQLGKKMSGQTSYLDGSGTRRAKGCARMCGCGDVRDRFKDQLEEAGLTPKKYLDAARRAAKKAGYDPKAVEFSDNDKHKLMVRTPEGRVKRFGAVGNGDFIIWSAIDKKTAAQKRDTFRKSHGAMKGNWRADKFSPNNLAINILW
jgi:hypothetical protein